MGHDHHLGAFIVKELSAGEFVGFVDTRVDQSERVATI